ncbi:uncharacterized protein LOC118232152 isoform X1 [Anguilla anguilla]|uniref:uncharacterized protein LOC118232152 isoform X1 n=1 Tax=Anguilla anguilla TaxID=7936 RepID=UPI0015ACC4B9|nr:uncharacterized protein LOC118232152 isoform X1 [Anguilla anguilla]
MASFLAVAIEVLCVAFLWFPSTEQNMEMPSYGQYCLKIEPVTSSPSDEKPVTRQAPTSQTFMSPSQAGQPSTSLPPTSQSRCITQTVKNDKRVVAPGACACPKTQTPLTYYRINDILSMQIRAPNPSCKSFFIFFALKLNVPDICMAVAPEYKEKYINLMANVKATQMSFGVVQRCRCVQGREIPVSAPIRSLRIFFPSPQCNNVEIIATLERHQQHICVSTRTPAVNRFIKDTMLIVNFLPSN